MQLDPCVKVSQEPRRRSNRAWTSQVWRPAKLRELKAAEVIFAETNADNGESTSESSHSSSKINNINNDNDNKNEEPGNYESANPSCHLWDNEIQNTNIYPKAFSFLPFPNCKPFKGSQKVASLTNAMAPQPWKAQIHEPKPWDEKNLLRNKYPVFIWISTNAWKALRIPLVWIRYHYSKESIKGANQKISEMI